MFWISAILGVIACGLIITAIVLFLATTRRVRKRYERLHLEMRSAPPQKKGKAA